MDKELGIIVPEDMKALLNVLTEEDAKAITELRDELQDNWIKKQIFRTETEMRVSVLDDVKRPTPAAKYWQAVREMSTMFNALMEVSFDIRENEIQRLELERKFKKIEERGEENDDLKLKRIRVKLDKNLYHKAHMEQVAHDRIRELKLWSKLKGELDDGTFDTTDPDTHQAISLGIYGEHRLAAIGPNSDPSEILNAHGIADTWRRLFDGKDRIRTYTELREGSAIKKIEANTQGKLE